MTIASLIVAAAALGATWVLGFVTTNDCSENVGSVTKQYADGLAIPCNLIGWIGGFAAALIVAFGAAAFTMAVRGRLWLAGAAIAATGAVPIAVAVAYASAQFD